MKATFAAGSPRRSREIERTGSLSPSREMALQFEVTLQAAVYVSVEFGSADDAKQLARRFVANGWLLQACDGAQIGTGRYVVKGLSAETSEVRPFMANPVVTGGRKADG